MKSKSNGTVPVVTVNKVMKLIREIPGEELSAEVADFCGDNIAYLVKEGTMPRGFDSKSTFCVIYSD